MTALEIKTLIMNTLSSVLPTLLSAEGLDDFDQYVNGIPKRSDDTELCIYTDFENDLTDNYDIGFIIQAQLYGKDTQEEYHEVIFKAIQDNITSTLVELQTRNAIESDLWPLDVETSTSYLYYSISFTQQLDDCD